MTKEQLAKALMVKWFSEKKGTDPEEVFKTIVSGTYKESTSK